MKIPDTVIASIIDSIHLVETIERKVKLKRVGTEYVGLCPFHNEKTPSFTVAHQKGFWHCFGCGKNGDALDFVLLTENLSFMEGLTRAAEDAGITLDSYKAPDPNLDLYDANRKMLQRYQAMLEDAPEEVWDYLESRGYTPESARKLCLGYAYEGRLVYDGIPEDVLERLGLSKRFDDPLGGRLIWPIRDRLGSVHGFGGRSLDGREPKYLNSRDSAVYRKREMLYGLPAARELASPSRNHSPLIVMEGYTDTDAAQLAGIAAVACCGTSMTREQIRLAFQISDDLVLCFDGDAAGKKATMRALKEGLQEIAANRQIRVVWLPEGHDPDSQIKESPEAFMDFVSSAPLASQVLLADPDLPPEKVAAHWSEVIEIVAGLPDRPFKHSMIQALKRKGIHDKRLTVTAIKAPSALWRPSTSLEMFMCAVCSTPATVVQECFPADDVEEGWARSWITAIQTGLSAASALRVLSDDEKAIAERVIKAASPPDPTGTVAKRLFLKLQMEKAIAGKDFDTAKMLRAEMDMLDER